MLSRSEYWLRVIVSTVVLTVLCFIAIFVFEGSTIALVLYLIVGLGIGVAQMVWSVQRIKDVGLRWTWLFITFIPIVGGIAFYILMFLPSDKYATYEDETVDQY